MNLWVKLIKFSRFCKIDDCPSPWNKIFLKNHFNIRNLTVHKFQYFWNQSLRPLKHNQKC
jgi:hypothetical protein